MNTSQRLPGRYDAPAPSRFERIAFWALWSAIAIFTASLLILLFA